MACEIPENETANLLIVEDDDGARVALGEIFDIEGYRVATCTNGRDALEYLHSYPPPDVIILDLQMPIMNGWQFRREQSRDANLAKVPVVVITAFQAPRNIDADEIVQKPIDIERLLAVVRKLSDANVYH